MTAPNTKMKRLDLEGLTPRQLKQIEKVVGPGALEPTHLLSIRFPRPSVLAWKKAAEEDGKSLRKWMQEHLDELAAKKR